MLLLRLFLVLFARYHCTLSLCCCHKHTQPFLQAHFAPNMSFNAPEHGPTGLGLAGSGLTGSGLSGSGLTGIGGTQNSPVQPYDMAANDAFHIATDFFGDSATDSDLREGRDGGRDMGRTVIHRSRYAQPSFWHIIPIQHRVKCLIRLHDGGFARVIELAAGLRHLHPTRVAQK